jgi:hypothetical protein
MTITGQHKVSILATKTTETASRSNMFTFTSSQRIVSCPQRSQNCVHKEYAGWKTKGDAKVETEFGRSLGVRFAESPSTSPRGT